MDNLNIWFFFVLLPFLITVKNLFFKPRFGCLYLVLMYL